MANNPITVKQVKRGESLMKPGDRVASVYVVQTGRLSVVQTKGEKTVEVGQVTVSEIVGEELVLAAAKWNYKVVALRDTKVVEVPVDLIRAQSAQCSPPMQALFKALTERARASSNEIRGVRMNREISPCPGEYVAKVFGVIFHVGRTVGTKKDGVTKADWREFKRYAIEVFQESSARIEEAVNILLKIGYADLVLQPDGESGQIILQDMTQIETFFDFYQNYYFKPGYGELLKTNAKMTKVTEAFLAVSDKHKTDRAGNVHMPYKQTIDDLKAILGQSFEADQLFRLEQKGLFIKKTTTQDGGTLSFYKPDFQQMILNWKLLKEVEEWNTLGYVELGALGPKAATGSDKTTGVPTDRTQWAAVLADWKPLVQQGQLPKLRSGGPAAGEIWCPTCMSEIKAAQKFCGTCGAEIVAKKAA